MFINRTRNATAKCLHSTALAVMIATSVAGCANGKFKTARSDSGVDQMSTGSVDPSALGRAYAKNPNDRGTALKYGAALQAEGKSDQALAVMRKLAITFPKDRDVLAAYGKSLAGAGQFEPALDAIRRAQTPEYPDWKLLSAEGAILDQSGKPAEARDLYRKALDLKPNEPSVLSNLGMSYVLEGDLRTAETYLKSASEQPGADSRVRQNLALVVGLQGRFQEAEKIASQEMSSDQAQANVAYLRSMLAQQNAWKQIKAEDEAKSATN